MYQFIKSSPFSISRTYPRQSYIVNKYLLNRDKLINYYRSNPKYIKNSHVLVRLIKTMQSLKTDPNLSLLDNAENIRYSVIHTGNTFNISTYGDVGNVQKSYFFNEDDDETLVMLSYELNESLLTEWKNIVPVRILCHDYQDMTPPFLNGRRVYGRSFYTIGCSVISIEPALLYYMFIMWKKEVWSTFAAGEKPTINNFVSQYILPNMFDSYIECAYTNRVMSVMMDNSDTVPDTVCDHPIYVPDITRYVDEGIDYLLDATRFKMDASSLLSLFIAPTGRSLMDIWEIPDQPTSRSIEWALTLSRLSMMAFVVARLSKFNMVTDKDLRNKLLRKIKQIKYNNIYPSVFGSDTIGIQRYIDIYIYEKINSVV